MSEKNRERRLKRQKNLGSLKLQTLNTPLLFLETQTQTNISYMPVCFVFSHSIFGGCGGKITCLPPNQTVVVGPRHHGNRSTSILLWEKRGWVDHVFDVDSTLLWGRNIRDTEKGKHNSSLFFFTQ